MNRTSEQGGYALASTAMLLIVLFGFVAVGIDLGMLFSARTAAQRAADAAALAGAFTFIVDPTAPQPGTAQQHALSAALTNNMLQTRITAPEVTVTVDTTNRLVTVQILHNQPTFFAQAIGRNTAPIMVRAVAEASRTATGTACVKPWFVPNTMLSALAACSACAAGQVLISNGQATAFAQSKIGIEFAIKPQKPDGALAPGQFYAIQLSNDPDQSGGAVYRSNIGQCFPQSVYCQDQYSVKTGDMVGPTVQGVRDLMGANPDVYLGLGRYQHSGGTISDTSPQLIVSPIWDTCNLPNFCPSGRFPSGTRVTLKIIGFALVFLEGVQGNNVMARFIGVSVCPANPSGGPAPPETGPYSIPVRLVRT